MEALHHSHIFNGNDILTILIFIFIAVFIFCIYKYFLPIKNFVKKTLSRPFTKLSSEEKDRLCNNSWCIVCGSSQIVHCKEIYLNGESWLTGNCIKCNQIISKKKNS